LIHIPQNSGSMTRKKIIALVLLPLVIALHIYLVWLGGGWRIFAGRTLLPGRQNVSQ
jgi:hypothetical protein